MAARLRVRVHAGVRVLADTKSRPLGQVKDGPKAGRLPCLHHHQHSPKPAHKYAARKGAFDLLFLKRSLFFFSLHPGHLSIKRLSGFE